MQNVSQQPRIPIRVQGLLSFPFGGSWQQVGSVLGLIPFPFCPTIVLFENRIRFPGFQEGGFLERRIPGKNGEGSTRRMSFLLGSTLTC